MLCVNGHTLTLSFTQQVEQAQCKAGPRWMHLLLKEERPHKQCQYPDEYVHMAMNLMTKHNVPASKMPSLMRDTFIEWYDLPPEKGDLYDWGHQRQFGRWRQSITFLVLAQCGMLLTQAAKDNDWTLMQDGSPVKGIHAEAFIIEAKDVSISLLPWYQYSKQGGLSAQGTEDMMKSAQQAYQDWYNKLDPDQRQGMPKPLPLGSLLVHVVNVTSDNAGNETKRETLLEEMAGRKFNRGKCLHHNIQLMAKALRKCDGQVMIDFLGVERDKATR